MSSIDKRPSNARQIAEVDGEPRSSLKGPLGTNGCVTRHLPFDELLTGLDHMIHLGQTLSRPAISGSACEEADSQ